MPRRRRNLEVIHIRRLGCTAHEMTGASVIPVRIDASEISAIWPAGINIHLRET
jgi:hypothetical protein